MNILAHSHLLKYLVVETHDHEEQSNCQESIRVVVTVEILRGLKTKLLQKEVLRRSAQDHGEHVSGESKIPQLTSASEQTNDQIELGAEAQNGNSVIKWAKHMPVFSRPGPDYISFSLLARNYYRFQGVGGIGIPVLAAVQGVGGIGIPVLAQGVGGIGMPVLAAAVKLLMPTALTRTRSTKTHTINHLRI
ncbi:MAG TPA: hypothetical protein VGS15_05940 [Candidatus Acidoferrales bacterium]|nr:hypothetical protein [Candidatus Acidoferrales bacterium]